MVFLIPIAIAGLTLLAACGDSTTEDTPPPPPPPNGMPPDDKNRCTDNDPDVKYYKASITPNNVAKLRHDDYFVKWCGSQGLTAGGCDVIDIELISGSGAQKDAYYSDTKKGLLPTHESIARCQYQDPSGADPTEILFNVNRVSNSTGYDSTQYFIQGGEDDKRGASYKPICKTLSEKCPDLGISCPEAGVRAFLNPQK